MAQFVSAGERRRTLIVSCIVSAVAALVAGMLIGRASVPTVAERAAAVRVQGNNLATRLSALTIEYEQALTGSGDTVAKGVDEPLTGIETELKAAVDDAPWVTPGRRAEVLAATKNVRAVAAAEAPAATFETAVGEAATLVREVLGAP